MKTAQLFSSAGVEPNNKKGEVPMTRGNLFWGSVFILVGVLFLLSTSGLIKGIDPWSLIWPTFLIILGVWILFGNVLGRRFTGEIRQVVIPQGGATSAHIRIGYGGGRLLLDDRAGPGELLSGSFVGGLRYKLDRRGEEVTLKLRQPDNTFPFLGWGWSHGLDWTFGLSRDIPLSLEVGTGANESTLDLTNLRVTELKLHTGASGTKVSLPENAGFTRVICEAGVAGLDLRVPPMVEARIRYRGGLSSMKVNTSRFPRSGGVYQSPGYVTAANKVDIDVQIGVGSVDIR
jgi:hypothetical protein